MLSTYRRGRLSGEAAPSANCSTSQPNVAEDDDPHLSPQRQCRADLLTELYAAQGALTVEHRATLGALGISDATIASGLVGVAGIQLDNQGASYQPIEDGPEAFITPARVGTGILTPEDSVFELVPQYGALIDLVAWSARYLECWATRRGIAGWLGAIPPQYLMPPAVQIRRSPASWLCAHTRGLCLLSRDCLDVYRVLSLCRTLEAEDEAHVAELQRILERPFNAPPITIGLSVGPAA
jgi:hypothetical protein